MLEVNEVKGFWFWVGARMNGIKCDKKLPPFCHKTMTLPMG